MDKNKRYKFVNTERESVHHGGEKERYIWNSRRFFLAKYRVAREAAIAGEKVKTLEALKDLEKTFKDQAFADNDDSISVKATLRLWAETWRKLAVIIEERGLTILP